MRDVLIKIKGTQGLDEDTDTIEFMTDGFFDKTGDVFSLSYNEGEMIGINDVKTILNVNDSDTVVLKRTGGIESCLTIQKGIRNTCIYNAGYGEMVIGIFGEDIKYDLSESGGNLFMSYTIDSNLKLISRNTIEISVREVKANVDSCI